MSKYGVFFGSYLDTFHAVFPFGLLSIRPRIRLNIPEISSYNFFCRNFNIYNGSVKFDGNTAGIILMKYSLSSFSCVALLTGAKLGEGGGGRLS